MLNHNLITRLYNPETQTIDVPTRNEIDEMYKWDLKDIYASDEEWETAFKFVEQNIFNYAQFEGKIAELSESFLVCI